MTFIVIQTAFLGDVVLTVPLLRLLKELPGVGRVSVVARPEGAEFLVGQSVADRVIAYDKRGDDRGLRGLVRISRVVRSLAADVAVIPHRSARSVLIAAAAGVPERIGFDESGGRALLTRSVRYRARPHEIERLADLAVAAGAAEPAGRVPFRLRVPDGGDREAEAALVARGVAPEESVIVLAPGSRWPTKRWPAERFGEAAATLAGELRLTPVVTGSGGEREAGRTAAAAAGAAAVDLSGELSLAGWVGLVARARIVLSNDSATAHVAAGLGVPVVAVFGPTVPAQGFAPYGDRAVVVESDAACRPCGRHGSERCRSGTLECMQAVRPGAVVDAALRVLGAGER